jgi:multicomponent K+:H+ antiporter subunit G
MTLLIEWVVVVLLLFGAGFALVGSWGLLRLDTFFKRLHGPSKATTLGVGCVLVASGLWFTLQGQGSWHELLITLFLFLTAPVSAHVLVKAALALDPSQRPPIPGPGPVPAPPPSPPAAETESPPRAGSAPAAPPG